MKSSVRNTTLSLTSERSKRHFNDGHVDGRQTLAREVLHVVRSLLQAGSTTEQVLEIAIQMLEKELKAPQLEGINLSGVETVKVTVIQLSFGHQDEPPTDPPFWP